MRSVLLVILLLALHPAYVLSSSFFQASHEQPYHLSIGAVLFDEEGRIACHHFEQILGQKDIYILMRESMEDGETILMTLERGLQEEFGACATPVAFLGCLSGYLYDPRLPFEKTTLYIACQVTDWDPNARDPHDPEACSIIEWLEPSSLIAIMQEQGRRFGRVDADESEMVRRALAHMPKSR
ncbi:MAG: NUDIX hydrolase [Chlamydiota bacterium]